MAKNVKLGVFDCTMIVVSLVIGMGIFRTPVNVARHVPDSFLFFFTWIVGGLIALCGALTYAEIGSRLPVMGGYYKIFSYGYHPSIAFAINCIILISNAASLAGVALIGAEYISGVLFPSVTDPDAFAGKGNRDRSFFHFTFLWSKSAGSQNECTHTKYTDHH